MTNGVLTITKDGRTYIKVVVGCDGYNIDKIVEAIRSRNLWSDPQAIWNLGDEIPFGCDGCRVVQYDAGSKNIGCEGEELDELYGQKFFIQEFNPRRKLGSAEYVRVVESA